MTQTELNIRIDGQPPRFIDNECIRQVVEKALFVGGNTHSVELSVVITGDQLVRQLNEKYRGINETTDVLSFALTEDRESEEVDFIAPPDGVTHLGEIVISYPQTKRQAEEQGHSPKRELALLLTHGVLHLLGYDHNSDQQGEKMRKRERKVLSQIEEEE
ncbi:MAG: rRNA maturation RNase YbeY [Dehalococcoidia bacterium]|nr:rRNA maturation RNase YbeY [Dehalococcoidia bacterium]